MTLKRSRLQMSSWLMKSLLLIVVGIGAQGAVAAISGTCNGGELSAVEDSCTATNTAYMAGDTDSYSFTVGADSGITGFTLIGTQSNFSSPTFQLIGPESAAGIFNQSVGNSINVLFDFGAEIMAGTYTFTFIGFNQGSYDLRLTAVPIPAAAWLFGSVLLALGIIGRKRKAGDVTVAATPA